LPTNEIGSARTTGTDYTIPADVARAWGLPGGAIDPGRNRINEFQTAGWTYAPDGAALQAISPGTEKLLGLFSLNTRQRRQTNRSGSAPSGLNLVAADVRRLTLLSAKESQSLLTSAATGQGSKRECSCEKGKPRMDTDGHG